MKRIALLICALTLLVANTAEARRQRWSNNRTYTQPAYTTYRPVMPAAAPAVAESSESGEVVNAAAEANDSASSQVAPASATSSPTNQVRTVSYSTATAQGVANLMASYGRVGHFGGNPGYEGCGCGATPAAAYAICCYANSGMATVDVGYAQGANGMWYCCRRYR